HFSRPIRLEAALRSLQYPDISVTQNGHVYVTFRTYTAAGHTRDAIYVVKSKNCGRTFSTPHRIATFIRFDAEDQSSPQPVPTQSVRDDPSSGDGTAINSDVARDCGDFADACTSGYTFFRHDTQVRSTANQYASRGESIYLVYDATKPATEESTGTTYGTDGRGRAGQSGIYFIRYNGVTGAHTTPSLIDDQTTGDQIFPDISADGGVLHAIWWDSRNDSCYDVTRPIGNCPDKTTVPSLDVYGATSTNGDTWTGQTRISDVTTNPNYEQFDNRAVPFAGDYLYETSLGSFAYTVWTDWRNTAQGTDPRETTEDADQATSDVLQCRELQTQNTKKDPVSSWSGDECPHDGGIDQNIYGDLAP